MPKTMIDQPEPILHLSILDSDGRLDRDLEPNIPADDLQRLYRTMVLARKADDRLVALQRQGRVSTVLSGRGQEAAALGAAYALRPSDWMVPYFRELAAYLWRGWPLEQVILYLAGYAVRFSDRTRDLPLCVPIASQLPHAVGLAYALRHKGEDGVALVFFGDGATSHGDFHEAMNFAGVFQVPVIFCCVNNQWALSVPVSQQTRAKTLARKALAYGIPATQVDGNDLLAVYEATRAAAERARAGGGPTFLELITYRLSPHSTADDPRRYRDEEEVRSWEAREPMIRFRRYLEDRGLLDAARCAAVEQEVDTEIRGAVEAAEARMKPDLLSVFEHVYPELPEELLDQRAELARYLSKA